MSNRKNKGPGVALLVSLVFALFAAPPSSLPAVAEEDCEPHCGGVHGGQAIEIPGGQYLCFQMPCQWGLCCEIIIIPK